MKEITVNVLKFLPPKFLIKWHLQTVQSQILQEQSDQDLQFAIPLSFVCVEVLQPSQPNGVMSSAVSLPNHTFTGQA